MKPLSVDKIMEIQKSANTGPKKMEHHVVGPNDKENVNANTDVASDDKVIEQNIETVNQ